MKTKHAIKQAGSVQALALLLGISRAAISQWGNDIPKLREYELRDKKPEWFKEKEKVGHVDA